MTYALTLLDTDLSAFCAALERFVDAERGHDPNTPQLLCETELLRRQVDDRLDWLRNSIVTEEGLPWGVLLNAGVEFSQLTKTFTDDAYPKLKACEVALPQLRTFMERHFRDMLAYEKQQQAGIHDAS